jgi:hypothetical protein
LFGICVSETETQDFFAVYALRWFDKFSKGEALRSNECLVALLVTEALQLGFCHYEYGFSNTTTSVCEEIIFNNQGAPRGRTSRRIATDG